MAVQYMTARQGKSDGYTHGETIADGVTGDWVVIPPMGMQGGRVSCTVIAGANTGKIQFTTSSDAAVAGGTAVAQDWPSGDSTGTVSDAVEQVTAIRGVSVSGEIKIELVV